MLVQFDAATRNAILDAIEASVGTLPTLSIWRGQMPANTGVADAGTKIWEATLPSDWMAAASGGVKSLLGTWQANAVAANAVNGPLYWRLKTAGAVVKGQGVVTITGGIALAGCTVTANNTSVTVPANNLCNGSGVSGTGITAGTYVVSGGGTTTLVLSQAPTAGGTVTLTFSGTLSLQNDNLVVGQQVTITSFDITAGNP